MEEDAGSPVTAVLQDARAVLGFLEEVNVVQCYGIVDDETILQMRRVLTYLETGYVMTGRPAT